MANKLTREILLTSFIICPIPEQWPAGTQARNNGRRRSLTDLIKYRLQSHPSLLRAVLRSAYLAVLCSSALLASVSQGQVSSTKAILCLPYTDQSMMTRSGLCAYTMTLAEINPPPGGCMCIQVTVQLNHTLAHKGRLQATCDVIQDRNMPPGQPSLVQCVFTMD
jgi:hypothetical protein